MQVALFGFSLLFALPAVFSLTQDEVKALKEEIKSVISDPRNCPRPPPGPVSRRPRANHRRRPRPEGQGAAGGQGGPQPLIAGLVRLSFHDCLGGCDGCLNLERNPDNAGLWRITDAMEPLYQNHSTLLSRADFWGLAAVVALDLAVERSPAFRDCNRWRWWFA